jgi:phage gp36-like protein
MAYATLSDLVSRFGEEQLVQLTDRNGSGVIDQSIVDQAINDASALIDGYLSGRYPVPLSPVPAILVGYACDLARYNLFPDANLDDVNTVRIRQRDAIRFLEQVGQGKLSLGLRPEPTRDNGVQFSTNQNVFGRSERG